LLLGLALGCASGGPVGPAVPVAEAPTGATAEAAETRRERPPTDAVEVTLLQLNDVYEITPVEGGRSGGMARVATLRERLAADSPHLLTLVAGDFFSPSALGTAKVDGERLDGKQMVAVLNVLGVDLATFGNHEFDLKEASFRQRLDEVDFPWVAANVLDADGSGLPGVEPFKIYTFQDDEGRDVRLGFFGVTLTSNDPDYVTLTDPLAAANAQVEALDGRVDALVALTHQALDQDMALVQRYPQIDLVVGGHEHENWLARRGTDLTPVAKADANARTVFVHRLWIRPDGGGTTVRSRLVPITDALPDDPETAAEVERWVDLGYKGFRDEGFEPEEVVTEVTEALDGREAVIRNGPTRLTDLIVQSLLHAASGSQAAVFNAGSIRIDDVLPPGPITQYDVIRILPFGGQVMTVRLTGELLAKALDQGVQSRGAGGFLQTAEITRQADGWQVAGQPLDPQASYTVAMNDYLAGGHEAGMEFLQPQTPGYEVLDANGPDVRNALIDELRRAYPASQ